MKDLKSEIYFKNYEKKLYFCVTHIEKKKQRLWVRNIGNEL